MEVFVRWTDPLESSSEMEARFNEGESVGTGWKHKVWRNIPDPETLAKTAAAARHYYGCSQKQELVVRNDDGSFSYEAVYGCEDDGNYPLEAWDGTCVLDPSRSWR